MIWHYECHITPRAYHTTTQWHSVRKKLWEISEVNSALEPETSTAGPVFLQDPAVRTVVRVLSQDWTQEGESNQVLHLGTDWLSDWLPDCFICHKVQSTPSPQYLSSLASVCTLEFRNMLKPGDATFNWRSEFFSHCRHLLRKYKAITSYLCYVLWCKINFNILVVHIP